jgi:hypothetical protein
MVLEQDTQPAPVVGSPACRRLPINAAPPALVLLCRLNVRPDGSKAPSHKELNFRACPSADFHRGDPIGRLRTAMTLAYGRVGVSAGTRYSGTHHSHVPARQSSAPLIRLEGPRRTRTAGGNVTPTAVLASSPTAAALHRGRLGDRCPEPWPWHGALPSLWKPGWSSWLPAGVGAGTTRNDLRADRLDRSLM